MKSPDNPEASQLTGFDYDFSEVKSTPEMQVCEFYEYARESRAVMTEVTAIRTQLKQNHGNVNAGPIKFGPRVQNLVQSHLLMMFAFTSGFPKLPWQSLSDGDKQIVIKYMALVPHTWRYATTCHNPPLSFALNEPGTITLDKWKKQYHERLPAIPNNEPIKFGFFAVNMKYGRAVLIEEFTKWLRKFEGKPKSDLSQEAKQPMKPKPPGRRGYRDHLNALGAMRLRHFCIKYAAAKKMMMPLKAKSNGMFYGHRESFNRAGNAAQRHFQKLFGWLDSAQPLHFAKPEQK